LLNGLSDFNTLVNSNITYIDMLKNGYGNCGGQFGCCNFLINKYGFRYVRSAE